MYKRQPLYGALILIKLLFPFLNRVTVLYAPRAVVDKDGGSQQYVMKRLRDHGLVPKYLQNVFQAIVVTHILYALPAWECFLSKELTGRIDAFLKHCYRCGFASDIERVGTLYDDACMKLFHQICSGHCLYDILPPENGQHYDMRRRAQYFCVTSV